MWFAQIKYHPPSFTSPKFCGSNPESQNIASAAVGVGVLYSMCTAQLIRVDLQLLYCRVESYIPYTNYQLLLSKHSSRCPGLTKTRAKARKQTPFRKMEPSTNPCLAYGLANGKNKMIEHGSEATFLPKCGERGTTSNIIHIQPHPTRGHLPLPSRLERNKACVILFV